MLARVLCRFVGKVSKLMDSTMGSNISRGRWMALAAALLGWMFDGLEQGLFPLVARPALLDLLGSADEGRIGLWFSVATAGFLVGAATGGVFFGWLGDRIEPRPGHDAHGADLRDLQRPVRDRDRGLGKLRCYASVPL